MYASFCFHLFYYFYETLHLNAGAAGENLKVLNVWQSTQENRSWFVKLTILCKCLLLSLHNKAQADTAITHDITEPIANTALTPQTNCGRCTVTE